MNTEIYSMSHNLQCHRTEFPIASSIGYERVKGKAEYSPFQNKGGAVQCRCRRNILWKCNVYITLLGAK